MQEELEKLINGFSRKFYAKLVRIADEFGVKPEEVVNEGVELYRTHHKILRGPMGKLFKDPEQLATYRIMQSKSAQLTAQAIGEEGVRKRALKGAIASAKARKRQKAALSKSQKLAAADGDE